MCGKAAVPYQGWSEEDLVAAALGNDRRAVEHLVLEHPPLQGSIGALIKRLDGPTGDRDELRAAARLGVLEALRRFDPARGVRFRTYAFHFIHGEMIKALHSRAQRRERAAGRKPARLVPFYPQPRGDAEVEEGVEAELFARDDRYGADAGYERVEVRSAEQAIRAFVDSLPENQRRLVEDVFWSGQTHAEAARARGISRPAATRTLQRVFARGRRDLAAHRRCFAA